MQRVMGSRSAGQQGGMQQGEMHTLKAWPREGQSRRDLLRGQNMYAYK